MIDVSQDDIKKLNNFYCRRIKSETNKARLGDKEAAKSILSLMTQRELTVQSLGWKIVETEDGFEKLVKK